jgi:hypothetical protein
VVEMVDLQMRSVSGSVDPSGAKPASTTVDEVTGDVRDK